MGRAHEVRAKAMAATAAKKSKLYSIYAKEIYQAAKGNPDPTSNDVLRRVIEKAKREQTKTPRPYPQKYGGDDTESSPKNGVDKNKRANPHRRA